MVSWMRNGVPISCGGGKPALAAPPLRVGLPFPRNETFAGTPGGSAPWPWAPCCWTACPCRSGAACPGSNCPPLSLGNRDRHWNPRACPSTGPPWATGAKARPGDAAACSPALAWLENRTTPCVVAGDAAADGVVDADECGDPQVGFAPSLALAANWRPARMNDRDNSVSESGMGWALLRSGIKSCNR